VFYDRKHYSEALAAYDKAVELDREFANAWIGRGDALRVLRRGPEAIDTYRRALALGGDAGAIKYCLAALGAEPSPVASPEHFIANLYDSYAEIFEQDLVGNLRYQMPAVIADAIRQHASPHQWDVLDMGCGTGLMGEQLRPFKRTLTGVDLSANMLEKARQRGIYDRLICSDIVAFLQDDDTKFDLAVAADVFIYLGDLSPIFRAVRDALKAGALFCFSVEAADDNDFVLRNTLRYAHSIGYLRALAERNGFAVQAIDPRIIREEAGSNVSGYLAVMRLS
jgi:predicted TPR repeat methyltransferase